MLISNSNNHARARMHIYVINLSFNLDRRAAMSHKLAQLGMSVEFFDAIKGSTINRVLYPMAAGLSDGEVGCYLSHRSVWKLLAESGFECALVLEDDVRLQGDLDIICDHFSLLPFDVDLIRLSSLKKAKGIEAFTVGARRLLIADMHPSGSQGYWLSRKGALNLLAHMNEPSQELDKALDRCWCFGLHAFLLDPPAVCEEADSISSISSRSSRRKPSWLKRRLEGLRRKIANNRHKRELKINTSK